MRPRRRAGENRRPGPAQQSARRCNLAPVYVTCLDRCQRASIATSSPLDLYDASDVPLIDRRLECSELHSFHLARRLVRRAASRSRRAHRRVRKLRPFKWDAGGCQDGLLKGAFGHWPIELPSPKSAPMAASERRMPPRHRSADQRYGVTGTCSAVAPRAVRKRATTRVSAGQSAITSTAGTMLTTTCHSDSPVRVLAKSFDLKPTSRRRRSLQFLGLQAR
jgi:hypothetical protein